MAQQSQQPIHQPEKGVQRDLLARRSDPVLPIGRPPERMHDGSEMLHRTVEASEGEARPHRSLLR